MRRQRMLTYAATVAVVGVATILLVLVAQVHVVRRRAEGFLSVLRQIQVRSTDRATVSRLIEPYRAYTHDSVTQDGLPEVIFWFDNRSLDRLRLAPQAVFFGHITFKDGVVIEKKAIEYADACGCSVWVTEKARGFGFADGVAPKEHPNHIVGGNWNSPTDVRHISIESDDTYDEVQRRKDWSYDLSCLTRLRGCRDAREMIPSAIPSEYRRNSK